MANYDRSKITPNLMALAQKFATRPGVHLYFTEPDDRKDIGMTSPVLPFWGMSLAVFGQVGTLDKRRTDFSISLASGRRAFEAAQRHGRQTITVDVGETTWKYPDQTFSNQQVPVGHYLWFEVTLVSIGDTKFYVNGAFVATTRWVGDSHMSAFQHDPKIGYHNKDNHQGSIYEIHWTRDDGKEMNIFPQNPTNMFSKAKELCKITAGGKVTMKGRYKGPSSHNGIHVAMADAENPHAPKAYHVIKTTDESKVQVILVTLGGTGPHVFSDAGSAAMSGTGNITGMKTAVIEFENFEPINVSIETGMKKTSLKWGI